MHILELILQIFVLSLTIPVFVGIGILIKWMIEDVKEIRVMEKKLKRMGKS